MFSRRTGWEASANELTEILNSLRSAGRRVIDLTLSNPTTCGLPYPGERITAALSSAACLEYTPDPRGLPSAREAVARYYRERGADVSPGNIFMTASTSESYSLLFKLLCDPGDTVLVPRPSYPLFDYLAALNDVRTVPYRLAYDGRWGIDAGSLRDGLLHSPRAVVIVDPHNPTGSFVSGREWEEVRDAISGTGAALIVDEVFRDFAFGGNSGGGGGETEGGTRGTNSGTRRQALAEKRAGDVDDGAPPLTFLLNGLSKTAALPQMKVGWIVVTGGGASAGEAASRLEIMNDTYLSANTPAQAALPELLAAGDFLRPAILRRVSENYAFLRSVIGNIPGCTVPETEGGWNATVFLPGELTDAACAKGVLRDEGVYCFPGFFFDFEEDTAIILSLIVPTVEFREGVTALAKWIGSNGRAQDFR